MGNHTHILERLTCLVACLQGCSKAQVPSQHLVHLHKRTVPKSECLFLRCLPCLLRCSLAPSWTALPSGSISESEHTAWETFASLPPGAGAVPDTADCVPSIFHRLPSVSSGLNGSRISEPMLRAAPHSRAALLPPGAPTHNVHPHVPYTLDPDGSGRKESECKWHRTT